jgi:hypothetical protein
LQDALPATADSHVTRLSALYDTTKFLESQMKASRPPDAPSNTPSDPSPAPEPIPTTEKTYYYDPFDGYLHSPTSVAIHNIKPETEDEAKTILLDCIERANSLALVASQYRQEDHPAKGRELANTLEMLVDLLDLGFNMIEWWGRDEEDRA